jgi:hypothetical protein
MSKRKCWWLFFHDWGKWKVTEEGKLTNPNGSHVGYFKLQQRECSKCGRIEIMSRSAKA